MCVRGTFFHIFFGFLGWREPRTWQLGAHGLEENKLSMLSQKGTKHSRVAHAMLPSHIVSHDMKLACHFPCFSLSKTRVYIILWSTHNHDMMHEACAGMMSRR